MDKDTIIVVGDLDIDYAIMNTMHDSCLDSMSTVHFDDDINFSGLDDYISISKSEHDLLVDRVDKLEKMLLRDQELRLQHPTLQQAWEEYQFLLNLAKNHCPGT